MANDLTKFLGAMKARGPLDPAVQRVLQAHCASGRIAEVADVVAETLLDLASTSGHIPLARGLRTKELAERAADASKHLAEDYAKHGVLCAKGYYPVSQLAMLIFRKWEASWSSVLKEPEHPHNLMDIANPDFIARTAIAAQLLFRKVFSKLKTDPTGTALLLPISDVEHLCVVAVKMMYAAYTAPDEALHRMLHGKEEEESSGGDELRHDDVG